MLVERNKTYFERRIQPILQYIGAIGATLMSIMYIVLVFILIVGFKSQNLLQPIVFAVVNAMVGLIIMQFLKVQGVAFAKNIPENKEILDNYYNGKRKDRKYKSIKRYWVTSVITDILSKGLSIAATTCGLIYIVIQGCHDYTLLLLAAVNLIMFICFGLLSLNKAFEYYNCEHIPYIKHLTEIENKEKETLKNDNN